MRRSRSLDLALTAVTAVGGVAGPAHAGGPRGIPGDCSGAAPIVCHFDVVPGVYDVSVVLGSADEAAVTGVRAEARRMMLGEIATEAGRYAHRSFAVDVREPEGEPTKVTSGTPGLTLTFTGSAPRVERVTVRPARRHGPTLFLAGDSTVCDQDTFPYTGWGQAIPQHLRRGVTVANYADSGESTGSFLAEPLLWAAMLPRVGRGDVVLLQFGHNDKTTTAEDYRANLTRMITELRALHAKPVLVSPPVRRRFDASGHLDAVARHTNGLGVDLPAEMAAVAGEQAVPYIDLTADSAALVEGLGVEGSKPIYLYNELRDNTHFSEYGADRIGLLVLARLAELRLLPHASLRGPSVPLEG
ncbi:lysophospholipase L1-like esterase [Actinoplanes campanulatus]|uniref:Lysophospholipase L1-like esterase n=1 Tax=Actinoplanes campanulatus TaxID=113559 RepID=A0A7W5AQR5_9ACTN|nr:rhamnogalacturonan acetylesterase [Actinoplanes campanulatus]MBB3100605.1 lysophospholipase L1-like esterase [Actinoplanes campanulatus]GGN45896.1 rhamnogalacturonan acetylesterase [Actinoplanes campanulatus]GID41064.1 rhamnogalacturonan acetylesterase [Actinoplanes campanulatus]